MYAYPASSLLLMLAPAAHNNVMMSRINKKLNIINKTSRFYLSTVIDHSCIYLCGSVFWTEAVLLDRDMTNLLNGRMKEVSRKLIT